MDILDAMDLFYERNTLLTRQWLTSLAPEDQNAIQLLALIFQLNDRHLPGYVHADTPHGIFNYKPEKSETDLARKFNARFKYQQEPVHKNAVIDSLYIHPDLFEHTVHIWLFTNARLASSHRHLLAEKLSKIGAWLGGRGLHVETWMISSEMVLDEKGLVDDGLQAIRNKHYLQKFYAESMLLAGKMPIWWLVQPDKESGYQETVQYIHRARFLPENEAIDLNTVAGLTHEDCLRQAVNCTQDVFSRPAINWLNLLVIHLQQLALPGADGAAVRARNVLYEKPADLQASLPQQIYPQIITEVSDAIRHQAGAMSARNMLLQIVAYERDLPQSVLAALLSGNQDHLSVPTDIKKIIQSYNNLFAQMRMVFNEIVQGYSSHVEVAQDPELGQIAKNILLFLSESDERIPVTVPEGHDEFVQGRVLIRHRSDGGWTMSVLNEDGIESELAEFEQLLALIAWGWVNHVLDTLSQISVECPGHLVKQVEARHVLEMLMQEIRISELRQLHRQAFKQLVQPLRTILFVNLSIDNPTPDFDIDEMKDTQNLQINCEQVLIDSWGGVYSRAYKGDQGLLACLCDWMNQAILFDIQPGKLTTHGYGSGNSTYLAQRIAEIYEELQGFLASRKNGRYLVRLSSRYYVFSRDPQGFSFELLGDERNVRSYLESGVLAYIDTGLDRLVLPETPLQPIYQMNKPGVVQLYFLLSGRDYLVWLLDECGSLFESRKYWFDKDTFIGHWLEFATNIGARLKKIRYQESELPAWQFQQISINPLGGYEFDAVKIEQQGLKPDYFNLKLYIVGAAGGDQISVRCDDAYFDYAEYGPDVINRCIRYMNERIRIEGKKPAYVTDIEAPLRLFRVEEREQIQHVHFLKYKQVFERRINQLLR